MHFAEMVETRLEELGENINSFERRMGWQQGFLRAVVRSDEKRTIPNIERAKTICDALDLELYIGPPRQTATVEAVTLDGDPYVLVPRLDVRLSAGPGALNHYPDELERLAFRRDWLVSVVTRADDACLVQVTGDSMSPGLHDGDLALVDKGRTLVRSGFLYALSDLDGSTRVKRVDVVVGSGYILRSHAPEYPAEARFGADAERIVVHGQVVWSGHVWEKS